MREIKKYLTPGAFGVRLEHGRIVTNFSHCTTNRPAAVDYGY